MLEQTMVLHCRSVMAGIKTANLFSYKFTDSKELTDEIRRLNGVCVPKGLRIVILSTSENRALIYAYRISKLREDFKDRLANSMLTRRSYSVDCPETCIKQLAVARYAAAYSRNQRKHIKFWYTQESHSLKCTRVFGIRPPCLRYPGIRKDMP